MEFILGIIIFIADIWAIINIFQAGGASTGAKVLWTLLILFLPPNRAHYLVVRRSAGVACAAGIATVDKV